MNLHCVQLITWLSNIILSAVRAASSTYVETIAYNKIISIISISVICEY